MSRLPMEKPESAAQHLEAAQRVPAAQRFRGLPREAREFFRALEREPCPDTMPGGDRAAYAAHVLSPLKALVTDLRGLLADVRPPLGSEARAGAGLDWPDGARSNPEDCPVRRIRFWDAGQDRDRSPILYVTFTANHLEVGASGAGLEASEAAALAGELGGEWSVGPGDSDSEESGSAGPADAAGTIRVSRRIPWEPWIDEPALLQELADDFRALLPVFDRMRGVAGRPVAVPGGAAPAPREQ